MAYTNSPLVDYTRLSPNYTAGRDRIDTITIHCVVGQCSVETLGNIFASSSRQASSNYGVGYDGRIGLYVSEANRSWCSSSSANDRRSVTLEVASDTYHPYAVTDAAYNATIKLVADICKRNGIKKLLWLGDKATTLAYTPKTGEAVMTAHRWFANKACPGDYLYSRFGDIAAKVNKILGSATVEEPKKEETKTGTVYRVQVGAYSNKNNANTLIKSLTGKGFASMLVTVNGIYRVQVGAYGSKANAEVQLAALKKAGFTNAFITSAVVTAKQYNFSAMPMLSKGSYSENVKTLQEALIALGYDLGKYGADRSFGNTTLTAVKKFQSDYGLSADGVVGSKTWAALETALNG